MVYCAKCGSQNEGDASHCMNCGEPLGSQQMSDFLVVTTPSIPGYKITKVISSLQNKCDKCHLSKDTGLNTHQLYIHTYSHVFYYWH